MRFLVDQQISPKLCRWLETRGHEARHIREFEMRRAADNVIWRKVKELLAILITKDSDFLVLNDRDQTEQVVHVRTGNCENAVLIAAFERCWTDAERRIAHGEGLIEIG